MTGAAEKRFQKLRREIHKETIKIVIVRILTPAVLLGAGAEIGNCLVSGHFA